MDPSGEIIPQRVAPEKKPRADGQTPQRSTATAMLEAVSNVLDDDDLLIEILLRVGFPTTLVRAALVCICWFHHISDHAFLRRFRELHPPRLLGFYVNPGCQQERLRFVPMLPQPPELESVIRRMSSRFDTYQSDTAALTHIINCRNGCVVMVHHHQQRQFTLGVHNLLCPERAMVVIPNFPCHEFESLFTNTQVILSKEEAGCLSYFCLTIVSSRTRKPTALIYRLQDGVWCMHNPAIEELPYLCERPKSVLVANKIYMAALFGGIVVLDLITSSFSTTPLPKGVEYGDINAVLSRADGAASVYFIHVEHLLLRVWLFSMDDWLLVDTIRLREMCASLNMLQCNDDDSLRINQVGNNAEFVFLEMGQWVLYLDIKCRTLRKVFEVTSSDPIGNIYPCMMTS